MLKFNKHLIFTDEDLMYLRYALIEAKFHNEFGLKSDVKVALYVKARFDDIALNTFKYGDREQKLTDRWLFTNTKFTEQATKYGSCNSLNMIGWNYPSTGNLHTIIEDLKLHPVTCITHLSHNQKRDLVGRGVMLCSDVLKNPDVIRQIGLGEADVQIVLAEAQSILG